MNEEMKKEMPYHITITNNETGEVFDTDSIGFIASVLTEDGVSSFSMFDCCDNCFYNLLFALLYRIKCIKENDEELSCVDNLYDFLLSRVSIRLKED